MSTIEYAHWYAAAQHSTQYDKNGEPYIYHVERVAAEVMANNGTTAQIMAAYLHDVVEDTGTDLAVIEAEFGIEVANIVDALTHRKNEPNTDYAARIRDVPEAVLVKLADNKDNSDPVRLASLDEATRERLTAKYEKMRKLLKE